MSAPLVSIVVPCFNNGHLLSGTLSCLRAQSLTEDRFEVLIVDDGSTDNTAGVVKQLELPMNFHYLGRVNRGAAAARNFGAAQSQARVILFLDSDVSAEPGLLQEHLSCHSRNSRALVVGRTRPMILSQPDSFWRIMAKDLYGFDFGEQELEIEFRHLISRNLSLTKASFTEIGGFDETFPKSGFEDTEFAYRAARQGHRVIYSPSAAGVHQHHGTLRQTGEHLYSYQISAALLMQKQPAMRGVLPHLRDKEPMRWGHESPLLSLRKAGRWFSALLAARQGLLGCVALAEKIYPRPRLLRFLYWQVLGTYLYLGYREGARRYG